MFAAQADPLPTTAYNFQRTESPLDTLVRRTSVRKENFPRQVLQDSRHDSPLLHGRFGNARDSYATASSKESSYSYRDDESVANSTDYTKWHGSMFLQTAQVSTGIDVESSHCVTVDMSRSHSPVPTVIVSSADANPEHNMDGGRNPIVALGTPNFSRPGRPVIPPSNDEKRRVLERNMKRAREPNPLLDDGAAVEPPSPIANGARHYRSSPLSREGETNPAAAMSRSSSRSPNPLSTISSPIVQTTQLSKQGILDSSRHLDLPMALSIPNAISLPRTPPSRSLSPATSLYSSYSYYPLEDPIPSSASNSRGPTPSQHLNPETRNTQTPLVHSFPSQGSRTPQEYLQLGIQCHEANKLEDSAIYFEKSAKENGGCGVGMLMWGLALRHGWGCRKDEKSGFKWLQRAAEYAVEDLESARIGDSLDPQTIRTEELVLAIYEVGQCFFQGWGVPKDKKMAVSYYEVAARLGDSDAQNDLAFCLANGKGCKKNRKEAAKWYRAAVAQGQSDVGLAWIYKEKYQ